MMDRLWIFPAVLCLLISLTFSEGFFMLGFFLCVVWFIRILYLKHHQTTVLSLVIGILFTGVVFYHQSQNVSHFDGDETSVIVFPKATTIEVDGNNVRFDGVLQAETVEENVVVQYRLETEAEQEAWLENPPISHLKIDGALEKPAKHSNFHQFNYRNYLKRQNTHWQLKAEAIQRVEHHQLSKPSFHFIEELRLLIFQWIDEVFDEKIASYLKTLFFADKRGFSEETLQQYRSLGVIHLFSISGFHITYLANLIKQLLLRLGLTHEHTNLLLVFILPLYGFLAGFGVSVFRAVTQNTLSLIGKTLNKSIDTLDVWALTMLLALFINPYQIFQISFQLSYTLSGIFILMSKQSWIRDLNALAYSFLFSLMSGLASLPIITYHFFEIPWVSVFANLLFIPFFTYVLFPALLALLGLATIFDKTLLFSFLNQLLTLLITFVEEFLAMLNNTFDFSFVTGRLPALVLILLILSVFHCLKKLEEKKRPKILALLTLITALFYHQLSPIGYVTMLDVGQGEAILIKAPGRQNITLIDTGGSVQWGESAAWEERAEPFSVGKDIVVPALKAFGISAIDRLYLTHPDLDHMGEMKPIAEEIAIHEVAATKETLSDPMVLTQLEDLTETDLLIINPLEAINYPVEEALAIHPVNKNPSKNNHSLVLYVKMGEDAWLFTGDIEKEAEAQLIRNYPNLQADILKVAHHGSQTSSTQAFIEHVQPKVALISVGEKNTFGHPNKEVLERFEAEGIDVYLTSKHGAIQHRYLKIPGLDDWFSDRQTVHKD